MRTRLFFCVATFGALALLGTPALAATLYTAPLSFFQSFGTDVECKITNVGGVPQTVRIRALTLLGDTASDSGNVVLDPHGSLSLSSGILGTRAYCRFDLSGSKRRYRASICTVGSSGACRAILPAE